jgi:hypothetical protein
MIPRNHPLDSLKTPIFDEAGSDGNRSEVEQPASARFSPDQVWRKVIDTFRLVFPADDEIFRLHMHFYIVIVKRGETAGLASIHRRLL